MIWYLASAFTIAPEIVTIPLLLTIKHFRDQPCHRPVYQTIINLLSWFQPLQMWEQILTNLRKNIHKHRNPNSRHPDNLILPSEFFSVFFLSLNPHNSKTLKAISLRPSVELYDSSTLSANNLDCSRPIQKRLCEINSTIPAEIFSKLEDDAPWEQFPPETKKALEYYDMVANTRAHVNLEWTRTIQPNLTQAPDHLQRQSADSSSTNYQNSTFQDSQDPWPIVPLRSSSEEDNDNLSDQNMDADHEPFCK